MMERPGGRLGPVGREEPVRRVAGGRREAVIGGAVADHLMRVPGRRISREAPLEVVERVARPHPPAETDRQAELATAGDHRPEEVLHRRVLEGLVRRSAEVIVQVAVAGYCDCAGQSFALLLGEHQPAALAVEQAPEIAGRIEVALRRTRAGHRLVVGTLEVAELAHLHLAPLNEPRLPPAPLVAANLLAESLADAVL